ncbi:MAG: tRNA uridine-5-carboxymethylaminomethyl(34) synthesis GTPase MnmE, partial [Bacteroidales bacterium]|nr:tRNA uridine-5-carboxymethylaminomethyl(34) synthesis GTPase MnmE [Bacteroidales bacterium]
MSTIAAISTPAGVGGIALVRLSGAEAKPIAERFVKPLSDHQAIYSPFVADGETVDEVVATLFKEPHSYTGDDVVEIACHGSIYIQQAILQKIIAAGARMAEPGEFTRRAFINGRLNLSQAEAVADLINSTSQASNQLAMSQLRGGYQQKLKEMRQELLDLTALLELELDFSQEDVEFADRSRLLSLTENIESEATRLVESFRTGNAVKNGIRVAIVGEPNVGKSSLLNALLDDDRAIVSNIPGTTRDTVEDTITIDGLLIRFIDTAGIRHTDNPIEQAGIDRSLKAAKEADVMIYVVEASNDCLNNQIVPEIQGTTIVAINKCDIIDHINTSTPQHLNISAKTGMGLDELKQAIVAPFKETGDGATLSNLR